MPGRGFFWPLGYKEGLPGDADAATERLWFWGSYVHKLDLGKFVPARSPRSDGSS